MRSVEARPSGQRAKPTVLSRKGAFAPVLAKRTKHLSLVDILAVGADRKRRSFEPVRKQGEDRRKARLLNETTKLVRRASVPLSQVEDRSNGKMSR